MQCSRSRGALAALILAGSSLTSGTKPDTTTAIQWGACDFNVSAPIVCGNFSVPLDYSDTTNSSGTLQLQLLKVPATKTPSKGSILFNFGGPGYEARHTLVLFAERLLASTGGNHDLIAFDPRGTANTIPFSCYKTDLERQLATLQSPTLSNASDTALGTIWAQGQIEADQCLALANNTGAVIGTPFVARDLMQVVDALGEDGLLRYYGVSYGTVLGATVAAMFPDRMDKVVLDGVVNLQEYYHGNLGDGFEATDQAFSGFFTGCVAAGKDKCALAGLNKTAPELEQAVYALFDTVKYHPVALPGLAAVLNYAAVKGYVFDQLYSPGSWPKVAQLLAALLAGEVVAIEEFVRVDILQPQNSTTSIALSGEANTGIRCADNSVRLSSVEEMQPFIEEWYKLSRMGGDQIPLVFAKCVQWKIQPKETYTGSFIVPDSIKTKKPLLLLGNKFDPVTPDVQAQNVSAVFAGSVVLAQNGYGHSSLAQSSRCTTEAVAAYFTDGTLPKPGTVCEVETVLFEPSNSSAPAGSVSRRSLHELTTGIGAVPVSWGPN